MSERRAAKHKRALVADLFCGAGSLSMGANDALLALGYEPQLVAVNHWPVAIETYAANHAGARAHCVTLDSAFPAELVPEGRLDLLMAGIECTYFSRARGGKPVNDQQRSSAWHVVRWATELRVKRLLLENVPEFERWGPVDVRTGKPVGSREGEYFWAWWRALESIGFRLEKRVLNCADYGDATTRERLFILGRSDGKPIRWPTPTHARGANMLGVPRWRAAREIIDWSIPGTSIFDRKRPLAPKTLARIAAGIVKFRWPEPFIVVLRQHCEARGIDLPLPTITAGGTHLGLVQPKEAVGSGQSAVEPFVFGNRENNVGKGIDEPIPTATTAHGGGIGIVEPCIGGAPRTEGWRGGSVRGDKGVEPFVLSQASGGAPREVSEPVPTLTTDGAHALIAPYYGSGSGETCRSVEDPLPTATGKARFGLVMPVTHNQDGHRARDMDEPLPTITCAQRGELAFITASFGERPTQAPRVHSIEEPAPTVCATGHTNLVVGAVGSRQEAVAGETTADCPSERSSASPRLPTAREYDILFRMLEPHELAAAMSISTPERPYHFAGNKTEVVRQIGQAVPRRTGAALAMALMGEEA